MKGLERLGREFGPDLLRGWEPLQVLDQESDIPSKIF